ncbi:hypothetical protein [Actinomyces faecalis]|uniref:hypothetical protein n=1 Tax=Actinomyces faecalis TaxID=2722820 RepID=UPI00155509E3|nr:hypothetical protein [Actinomyces faecalis]
MTTIQATATRSGSWWAVEVPVAGTTQYTQGRTLTEALDMARGVVAIMAEEEGDPALADATVELQVAGPLREVADTARTAQDVAEAARVRARTTQARAVTDLLAQGLTMQDVATLMGITKGRVSQIAKAAWLLPPP